MPKNYCIMQIWAESGKSALPICNYSQILYQFLTFTQNLKRSRILRYGRAASPVWREPPVRTNGATPFCLLSLLCHCWIQSIYFSHREVFSWVNTFNIDFIGIIRNTIHDSIGKSTFTITDLLVPLTFSELRTKDC